MITIKLWCTKCDCLLQVGGVALDCPTDGIFMICPKCGYRIVLFTEKASRIEKYISAVRVE